MMQRVDLNHRPPGPETQMLSRRSTRLSYAIIQSTARLSASNDALRCLSVLVSLPSPVRHFPGSLFFKPLRLLRRSVLRFRTRHRTNAVYSRIQLQLQLVVTRLLKHTGLGSRGSRRGCQNADRRIRAGTCRCYLGLARRYIFELVRLRGLTGHSAPYAVLGSIASGWPISFYASFVAQVSLRQSRNLNEQGCNRMYTSVVCAHFRGQTTRKTLRNCAASSFLWCTGKDSRLYILCKGPVHNLEPDRGVSPRHAALRAYPAETGVRGWVLTTTQRR